MEKKSKSGEIETIIVEIKPEKQTIQPKITPKKKKKTILEENMVFQINKSKWESAKTFCDQNSWKFVIITEKELFNGKQK